MVRAPDAANQIVYEQRRGYYVCPPSRELHFNLKNESGRDITLVTDEFGLRNPKGALRDADIVVLGDSFIMGSSTPEEETLVGQLRRRGLKAYNAGVGGYSTFQASRLLEDLLKVKTPRVVVLAFYLGNDFRDNYFEPASGPRVQSGGAREQKADTPKGSARGLKDTLNRLARYLLKRSRLFERLYQRLYLGLYKGYSASPMASFALSEMESYRRVYSKEMREAVDKTDLAVSGIATLLKERNVKFLILGVPSKAQVAQSFNEISRVSDDKRSKAYALKVIAGGYSFDVPDERMREIAAREGIPYVSLLEIFRNLGAYKVYYQVDPHWNPEGQKIAADCLVESLK
jgi:hypothetical protein